MSRPFHQFNIVLPEAEAIELRELAAQEYRTPRDQASYMVLEALRNRRKLNESNAAVAPSLPFR